MKTFTYLAVLSVVLMFGSPCLCYAQIPVLDGYEIFLYDGTSKTNLTKNLRDDGLPQINDNGWVVWKGCDSFTLWGLDSYHCGGDYEIFLYDGTSTTQLTDNDYHDGLPQINNNGWVVWEGFDGTDWEIFLYDGTSTTQFTNNDYDDVSPKINSNGYMAWGGCVGQTERRCDTDWEIFLYDGSSTTQLTNNDYNDISSQIADNGHVVWQGCDGADCFFHYFGNLMEVFHYYGTGWEVFHYDGTGTTQLTNNDYNDIYSQIADNGHVVWQGYDGSDYEIFLHDGASTTQITTNSYSDKLPQINANGDVVWYGYDGSDYEIFLYDGTSTTQLTDNSYPYPFANDDGRPQLNDNGWVVWDGSNIFVSDARLFLYNGTSTEQLTHGRGYNGRSQINNNGWIVYEAYIYVPGCFIATAAFGTELDGKIDVLRSFRDRYLVDNAVGQGFLSAYYRYSPTVADYIAQHRWLKALVRTLLLPVVGLVSLFV